MPSGSTAPHATAMSVSPVPSAPGTPLVIGLILLGLVAAATGIWYQREQTRRCLDFYGVEAARRITTAARIELLELAPTDAAGRLRAVKRREITAAKGLVHLRRGLVEDANFNWSAAAGAGRLPDSAWDLAFVFSDPAAGGGATTTLVVDFDDRGGHVAVVGRPGRIGLGRLERGLQKWVGLEEIGSRAGKPAF